LKKPGIRIDEIEIISEEERKQVLYDFNDTGAIYSRDKTLQQLFEEQEERTPDRVVLLGSKLQNTNYRQMYLTYRQLKERSHRLAGLLIEKGIQPDTIVGIMVERSLEMMIGIIGILKSGGAYLPIDPNFPGERIDYMLKDSNAQVLVVDDTSRASWLSFAPKALLNLSEGHHLNFPASQLPSFQASLPSSLAYVIYTSGSTGKPKGVMIQHRPVINFIKGITDIIPFTADDCSLSLTTLSFDIFGLETILPITKGSKVVIGSEEEQADARKIASAIEKEKVTIFQVIPTRLKFILMDKVSSGTLKRLKYLLVGGEAFPPTLLEEAGKVVGGKIYNVYGPTETTIWSTIRNLTGQKLIDIGKPLVNTLVYILNKNHRPQPIKVPGDLYIGGEGLARGYVNRPELTAEKFDHNKKLLRGEPDPWISSTAGSHGNAPLIMVPRQQPETNKNQHKRFAQHIGTPRRGAPGRRRQKIYHTGDQARWLPDGNIEFLGRTDHQVKIRGFRVETREIESRLLHHPLITEAVVTARQDGSGDKYLCAYIVSEVELPVSELREHLAGDLPDYMIPSYFMRLEQIPLTSNGKIDRKALPEPGLKPGEKYVAPRDDIEKKLVSLYTDILLDRYQGASSFPEARIGIDDNFFELGGHSLKAIILVSKIHKELNVRLSLAVIFRIPTIRALALHIESSGTETFKAVAAVEERDYYPLSTTQRGIFIQQKKGKELTAYNIPQVLNLDFDIDKERLEESFKKLIHRHDSLRTSFRLINSDPVQQVHRDVGFIIRYYDNIKEEEIREIMATFVKPFDFDTPPLLRVGLIRWDRHRYILLFDMHHIITDGVSYEILRKEVVALYRGEKLPPLPIQYKDYSLWQNSKEVQEAIQKQKQVWLGRFAGEIPLLKLPLDFKRPAIKDFVGKQVDLTVGSELTTQLNRLAKQTDTTLYMVLLAAYFVLLSRYSQQEDIVVGSPVSGRRHADLHNIIGMFVNMLAIRNRPGKNKRFEDFLREVKESVLESIENQDYHFEELVIDLGLQGDPSRNPLFDVVFSMQSISESTTGEVGNENGREDRIKFEVSRFDLLLDAAEISGQIIMKIEYSTSLFNRSTIEDIARHYLEILQQVVENVSLKLEEIKLSHRLAAIKSAAIHEDGNFGF
jgi:amino acid adenylation domain-containing protein